MKERDVIEKLEISRKMLSVLANELNSAKNLTEKRIIMQEMNGVISRMDKIYLCMRRKRFMDSLTRGIRIILKK